MEKVEESVPPPPLEAPPPAPIVEPPHVDAPTPVVDVPAPVVEAPAVETSVVETPVVETPAVETPVVEAPVVEAPVEASVVVAPEVPVVVALEPASSEPEKVPEPPIIAQEQPEPIQASEPVKAVEPVKEEIKEVEPPKATELLKVPEPELIPPPEPAPLPVLEVPAVESEPAPVVETAVTDAAPAAEPVAESVPEPAPEPASEPALEAAPEAAQEPSAPVEATPPFAVTPDIDNSSLETVLEELTKEMKATVDNAVAGYEVSSDAVLNHINIMQRVLESNLTVKDDAAWNEMFEAAVSKSDAVKAAEIKEREAIAAIDNVIESIAAGRKNRTTSTNPSLLVAEEEANRAIYLLDQAKVKGTAIQGEAKVMEEYRELVEAGRQQFQKEMASIMPDVKLGEQSGKLTEDELNMFITHAYRKVLFLQQELAKQQTLEQERFKKALEKQRMETQMVATEKIESELERQKRDLELEHERRMAAIRFSETDMSWIKKKCVLRDEAEGEMRAQLRRQAAAHSDHLADVLSVQVKLLKSNWQHCFWPKLLFPLKYTITSTSRFAER